MNFRRKSQSEALGFQIAPMIDIVFILLTFFMTTQIYARWEKEISVKLPTAETGKVPDRLPGEIIINIRPDGDIVINRQVLSESGLRETLARVAKLFPGQPVVVRADKQTSYEHVIRVLDLCRQADIWTISFATSVESRTPEPGTVRDPEKRNEKGVAEPRPESKSGLKR